MPTFDDFEDYHANRVSETGSSPSFDSTEHQHDDTCETWGCPDDANKGSAKGTDNSSHVKDTASHPNRKVRARFADMVGGGTAYAGPKEEKEPKKPLRDRIADKIATKPKDESSSTESAAPKAPHEHDFDCDDFCDK